MFAISGLHCGLLTFFCLTVASKSLPFLTWIVFFAFCQTYCTFTGPASRCGPPWFQCVSSIGAPFQNIENAGILKFSSNCIASAPSPPQIVLKDSKHITEPRTSSQAPNLNHPPWPCDIWVLSFQNIPKKKIKCYSEVLSQITKWRQHSELHQPSTQVKSAHRRQHQGSGTSKKSVSCFLRRLYPMFSLKDENQHSLVQRVVTLCNNINKSSIVSFISKHCQTLPWKTTWFQMISNKEH
jgi:hypothetical protein